MAKWTDEQRSQAHAMRAQGMLLKDIGAKLGRSARAMQMFFFSQRGGTKKLDRKCLECAAPITDISKSGKCRPCNTRAQNADPVFNARRLASLRANHEMAAGTPKRREAARKAAITRMTDPVYAAWLRENMRSVVSPASRTPEVLAKIDRKAAGRKISETKMGWCPPNWRAHYHLLIRKQIPSWEARQMILAEIERAKPKPVALSPFERQERALAAGAGLQDNAPVTSWSPAATELRAKIG